MTRRKRWVFGLLMSIPVVGTGLAYTLPPMDEYAALDQIGVPVEPAGSEWPERVRLLEPSERELREAAAGSTGMALASFGSAVSTVRPVTAGLYEQGRKVRLRIWRLGSSGTEQGRTLSAFFSTRRGWRDFDMGGSIESPIAPGWYVARRFRLNDETGDCASLLESSEGLLLCVEEPEESTRFAAKVKRWSRLAFSR